MIATLLATATVTLVIPPPRAFDCDAMLDVIAQAENWNHRTPGAAGEWGPWQMLQVTWAKYMNGTIRAAPLEQLRYAAWRHLQTIIADLTARHHAVTPFNVGLAWNGGINLVGHKTVPRDKLDYANRCEALYESHKS